MHTKNYLQKAEVVAGVFCGAKCIAGVGLYGSVAKGDSKPKDIDLIVFDRGGGLYSEILLEAKAPIYSPRDWDDGFDLGPMTESYPFGLLGATRTVFSGEQLSHVIDVFGTEDIFSCDFDILFFPDNIHEDTLENRQFLWVLQIKSWDNNFLRNVTLGRYKNFNQETGRFKNSKVPWSWWMKRYSEKQKVFCSSQIISPEQIGPGMRVALVGRSGEERNVTIEDKPQKRHRTLAVRARTQKSKIVHLYLPLYGVVPYASGKWDNLGYMYV